MNKHFSAILAIMDAAEIVPGEIKLTKEKNIVISSDAGFDEKFSNEIKAYCDSHCLVLQGYAVRRDYYLILNPKNA